VAIASIMRRLLAGHAVSFNKQHRRYGHLFQNCYKSVRCEEESRYLQRHAIKWSMKGRCLGLAGWGENRLIRPEGQRLRNSED
jgi:ribosomal protein S19E (S16A)